MKHITPAVAAKLDATIQKHIDGTPPDEIAKFLGCKNASSVTALISVLRRAGAVIPRRKHSRPDIAATWKEFQEYRRWKAEQAARFAAPEIPAPGPPAKANGWLGMRS